MSETRSHEKFVRLSVGTTVTRDRRFIRSLYALPRRGGVRRAAYVFGSAEEISRANF